jgi:SAM-dependent methyltransferase
MMPILLIMGPDSLLEVGGSAARLAKNRWWADPNTVAAVLATAYHEGLAETGPISRPPEGIRRHPLNSWDERYRDENYFYGRTPNYFVAEQLQHLEPGRGLYLAEGEGRNAVFAAGLGHRVTAVDSSVEGRRKALDLAADRGVQITYTVADLLDGDWHTRRWDHVVLCFAHMPPEVMPEVHRRAVACLVPGGTLVHVSFSKAQHGRGTGGPPDLARLHDLDELREQYAGLDLEHAEEREVELMEADGHRGPAMVIELLGTRPAD